MPVTVQLLDVVADANVAAVVNLYSCLRAF